MPGFRLIGIDQLMYSHTHAVHKQLGYALLICCRHALEDAMVIPSGFLAVHFALESEQTSRCDLWIVSMSCHK